ncbi:MAG: NADH-quinone oxidoreductase subunit C [Sedimentisphaerales bacterium]|nr:NADH-quinone oxidoreductase subunit C [Sedimentisphaerales bacterium]
MDQEHPSLTRLQEHLGDQHLQTRRHAGLTTVIVPKSILPEIVRFLHDDPESAYEQLTDVVGIDYRGYPGQPTRFAIAYPLLSLRHNRRLIVKVLLAEPDLTVPSLTGIYPSAEWAEREAAEMFGFTFEGHPDPRRLLLSDLFENVFPLRKDYPLRGAGERISFTPISRDSA